MGAAVRPRQAMEAGLRFLEASQEQEGCWRDWDLPLGESRAWTTAYTGYRLSSMTGPVRERAQDALRRAGTWLAGAELPGGGWGYNEAAGPDADSTALAILFLSAQGVPVPARSYQRLCSFQRGDGGFSTYTCEQSLGEWTESHSEVTAVAIPALLTVHDLTEGLVARAAAHERAQATPEGLWTSYWWSTPLYATEANLRWLTQTGEGHPAGRTCDTLLRMRVGNVFETALLVLGLLHAGCSPGDPTFAESIGVLCDAQRADGSWPSEPILRLPPRDRSQPWAAAESARLFADKRRIFTTATVLAALSAASSRT